MRRSCPVTSSESARNVRVTSPEPSSVLPRWKSQLIKVGMGVPFPLDQSHPSKSNPRARLRPESFISLLRFQFSRLPHSPVGRAGYGCQLRPVHLA